MDVGCSYTMHLIVKRNSSWSFITNGKIAYILIKKSLKARFKKTNKQACWTWLPDSNRLHVRFFVFMLDIVQCLVLQGLPPKLPWLSWFTPLIFSPVHEILCNVFIWKINFSYDATHHVDRLGRYINDSPTPNSFMKAILVNTHRRLCLFALKDVAVSEEICYNYDAPNLWWREEVWFLYILINFVLVTIQNPNSVKYILYYAEKKSLRIVYLLKKSSHTSLFYEDHNTFKK